MDSMYRDDKMRFVVMLIPVDFQLYPDARKKYDDVGIPYDITKQDDPHPQKRIKDLLDKEGIPYIDLLPVFKNTKERVTFVEDGHWNKIGHTVAAHEIIGWINKNYH